MANTENSSGAIKLAGYLEKKGKKRVVSIWKKYWFVLEGRLLLYYKSQSEVTNLCPCRGSINMGLATGVRPLTSQTHGYTGVYVFEIVTHINNTVLLRTKDKATQDQWLQALLDALCQPKINNPIQLSHFRYSMDSLMVKNNYKVKEFKRQNTLPQNINLITLQRGESFFKRIKRIRGSCSQSLDTILKQTESVNTSERVQNDIAESSSDEEKDSDKEECDINFEELKRLEHCCTYDENKSDNDIENKLCNSQIKSVSELTSKLTDYEIITSEKTKRTNDENEKKKRKSFNFKFSSKEDEAHKVVKVKRKSSFLQKFFKHKKKETTNDVPDDADYEYIDITFEKNSNIDDNSFEDIDIDNTQQRKIYGAQELILPQTLHELNEKLKPINALEENQQSCQLPDGMDEKNIIEEKSINECIENEEKCPELPPRTGVRRKSQSPMHDIPKNNSLIKSSSRSEMNSNFTPNIIVENETTKYNSKSFEDINVDNTVHLPIGNFKVSEENINNKILYEDELKRTNITDSSELTVRELIQRFNQCNACVNTINKLSICKKEAMKISENTDNIILRKEHWNNEDMKNENIEENRNSEELNQLLDELSKITTPPVIQPRTTSSLIQEKTKYDDSFVSNNYSQLTDEEWLLLFPIRKRRYSEPDYDVPRSHRSCDFAPPLPPKITQAPELFATRFLETTQSPNVTELKRSCTELNSIQWFSSITPDSLEPNDFTKKQDNLNPENMLKSLDLIEKNITLENNDCKVNMVCRNIEPNNERFFDSLEQSTLF